MMVGGSEAPDKAPSGELRRLAVMYSPLVLVLQLREVAAERWRILWVVDRSVDGVEADVRILSRLGTVIDITNHDIAAAAAAIRAHGADGIIAFDESELIRTALLAQALGLPTNEPVVARRLVNKAEQRAALTAAGLDAPHYQTLRRTASEEERRALAETIRYPAILKPQAGTGSRDTYRLDDAASLLRVLDEIGTTYGAHRNTTAGEPTDALGTDSELIIEELLADGWPRSSRPYADFVSVESIVSRGHVSHLAVTGRATLAEPFRETGNFIPTNLPAPVVGSVIETAAKAIAAVGATTGCLHTEIKLTPDGPRVIEVNGRVGGAIPELLMLATGKSILEMACDVCFGEHVRYDSLLPCTQVGFSLIMPPPVNATRLLALDNLDSLTDIPGIRALDVSRGAGDAVDWRDGYHGRIYMVYGTAPDHDAMWRTRAAIQKTVRPSFA